MRRYTILLLVLLGCGPAAEKPAEEQAAAPTAADTVQPAGTNDLIISGEGIGAARIGMTVGELRAALPSGSSIGALDQSFMVDLTAVPVIEGNDTLYYLLFSQLDALSDTLHLQLTATLNPRVKTAAGVGPGTSVADAARAYGRPTLSYNTNDESREYAKFPQFTGSNVLFRVAPNGDAVFVGRYTTEGEYNETTDYDPAGRIRMILVDLWRR